MYQDGFIVTAPMRDRLSPGPLGVRKHIAHKCLRGYTLFSTAFGSTEYLIDMNGMVVHTWPVTHTQYAELLPNGHLMVDNVGWGIEELAPDGKRVWSWSKEFYHHDFHLVGDNEIVLLVRREEPPLPGYYAAGHEPKTMKSDVVLCIDRQGNTLWEFPFRDHVQELRELAGLPFPVRYATLRAGAGKLEESGHSDWAHTNTIEVLPDTPLGRRDRRFRAGNLLFSFRALDIIGVADVAANKIVWAWGLGVLDGQHQPTMTPAGTILVFDNGTARGFSAVVEIDPAANTEIWRYEDRAGFFSAYRSGVQRLANGNTLVAESDAGRIFEITPEKEVVWDYYSPFLGQGEGAQGRHVYRATRYSDAQVEPLIQARSGESAGSVFTANHIQMPKFPDALCFYRDGLGG
ncbi:MAG: Arylsulfotransferase (ASST) [candidate division BRC1 bacterium ADurb.BinA364]|nr:MAG: Arylsulfotransferase (ASST) [candidate division BRC1 bacterium ADurb.BinA364]